MIRFQLVTLAIFSSVAIPANAQTLSKETIARIDSVFGAFDRTDRPGCALAVSRNGAEIYSHGYGMSDLQYGLAISPGSIFHVASISKQFAAFAVALLAQDGKLSLDDQVRKYVPELPDYGKPITIRHLIYHTSGIRDQWELLSMAGWRYGHDLFTQTDVLEILERQRSLNFNPGDEYTYSNSGYSLIAMIVERISGKTLRQFSDERIFKPLGMTSTHVHDDHQMIVPNRTSAYEPAPNGGWRISIPTFDTHGATSLFSTPGDLLKWEQNFVTATVGSRALLDEAERSAKLNNGKDTNYGFGISLETYRGVPARGHGGADAGYRGDVVRFPNQGVAIAALCNFSEAVPGSYARAVADIVLEKDLQPRTTPVAATGAKPSETLLQQLAGVYRKPGSDQAWTFGPKDGQLVLETWGFPLSYVSGRRFAAFGLNLDFFGPEGAAATSVRLGSDDSMIDSMMRVPSFAPTRTQLATYVGSYYSADLDAVYTIALADSGLTLRRPKNPPARMKPAFQDAFTTDDFVVAFNPVKGKIDGFALSGGRVRRVMFSRSAPRK